MELPDELIAELQILREMAEERRLQMLKAIADLHCTGVEQQSIREHWQRNKGWFDDWGDS